VQGADYCFAHDPALTEKRHEARSRSGRARHGHKIAKRGLQEPVEIDSLGDVIALLNAPVVHVPDGADFDVYAMGDLVAAEDDQA
jgi:hypothetical protein